MSTEVYHIPALLPETLEALDLHSDGTYVDATFGGGGHSRAILNQLGNNGHLVSFDQDEEAIANAFSDPRFTIVHGNFRFLRNYLRFHGIDNVDGILADLGVSFHHFDDSTRGFSFRYSGPLDMRMNRRATVTAAKLLADSTDEQLTRMFSLYGELRCARRLAQAIVSARTKAPVDTIERFLEVARPFVNPRQEKKELAQMFQALRIEVNNEIHALKSFLTQSLQALKPGGRLAIITYHSLEDRLVKNFMRSGNLSGEVERDFFGRANVGIKPLTSKPIVPSDEEVERNPRSRSAKLRVAVKL